MLDKNKLRNGIDILYTASSAEDNLDKWDEMFKSYYFDNEIKGFKPQTSDIIKPLFSSSITKEVFVKDFGDNLLKWTDSVVYSNGKDTKKAKLPDALDFKTFSDIHKDDTDINVYKDALADTLHNWFIQITSF